jgi:hypothetical protein
MLGAAASSVFCFLFVAYRGVVGYKNKTKKAGPQTDCQSSISVIKLNVVNN